MNLRALALSLSVVSAFAYGHAVVTPANSSAGQTQQYTLHVPNEKDVPTLIVELQFPPEIDVATVDEQDGWRLALKRDSNGRITSATWTGSLPPKAKAGFTFTARNSSTPVTVAWNVVQTYDGNITVKWTGAAGTKTPASRTSIH